MAGYFAIVLSALFGAAIQEVIYWFDLRRNLDNDEYVKLRRSLAYWVVTALMIVGSAIGTAIWFSDETVSPKNAMVFGAAFPLFLKHVVSAAGSRARLGTKDVLRSYFKML
jgi:hypothetical protein